MGVSKCHPAGPECYPRLDRPQRGPSQQQQYQDKDVPFPGTEERCFRGTLREDETWAKIARTKARRVGGGTDGVSTQTSSLTPTPAEAERTKRCLAVMSEAAATDAVVSACCSKERCRCCYSSSNGNAVTATDLGPMPTTPGERVGHLYREGVAIQEYEKRSALRSIVCGCCWVLNAG